LLACDTLIVYRLRWKSTHAAKPTPVLKPKEGV